MNKIAFYVLWFVLGFSTSIAQRFYPARGPAQSLKPVEWTLTIAFGPASAVMYLFERQLSK